MHLLEPPKIDCEITNFLYGYGQPIVHVYQYQPMPPLLASEHPPIPSHTNSDNRPYLPGRPGDFFLYAPYSLEHAQNELRHKPEGVHLQPVDAPYEPEELEPLFGLNHHTDPTLPPLQPQTRRMKIFEMSKEEYFDIVSVHIRTYSNRILTCVRS